MLTILLDEFVVFLKDKKIIEGAIMFAVGNMLRTLMVEVNNKLIIPFSKGEFKKLKNERFTTYVFLIFQIVFSAYVFFLLYRGIDASYEKILKYSSSYEFLR